MQTVCQPQNSPKSELFFIILILPEKEFNNADISPVCPVQTIKDKHRSHKHQDRFVEVGIFEEKYQEYSTP